MKRVEKAERQKPLCCCSNVNQGAYVIRVFQEWVWNYIPHQRGKTRQETDDLHLPSRLAQYSTKPTYQTPKRTMIDGATRTTWYLVYRFSKKKKSSASAIPGATCRARSILSGIFIKVGDADEDVGSDVSDSCGRMRCGNRAIKVQ